MQPTIRSYEEIELRAYQIWQERGSPWGTPEADWFKAEQELSIIEPEGILLTVAREVGSALGSAVAFLSANATSPGTTNERASTLSA